MNWARPMLRRAVILLGVFALVSAACGDDDAPSTTATPTTAATTAATTAPPETTAAPTTAPVAAGGELVVAVSADTGLVDGHQITQGTEMRMMYPNYDRLLEEGADGSLVPVALESYDVSADGLEYTLHVRPGMTFHDGTPVDAEAVKWNFDRQMQKDHPQGQGGLVPEGFICSLIVWDPFVNSVTVVDPLTVKVTLNEPFGPFITTMTLPCGNLMSPTAAQSDGEGFLEKPTGSGPFVLVDASQAEQTIYEGNPNYWRENAPQLSKLTLVPMQEASTRWAALQSGQVQMATELPPDIVREAMDDPEFNVTLLPARHFAAVWVNQGPDGFEPFRNAKVRQAMAMAIDKEALVRDLLDPLAYVAHGPIPDGNNWQNPDIKKWSYDVEAAKALLTEAGYPDGFEFTLSGAIAGAGMIEQRAVAAFIQSSLAQIGITVNVSLTEFADAYTRMSGGQDHAYLYGITYWMAEPWNQLSLIHQTGQFSNWGRYSNPVADDLMSQADNMVGFDARKVLYDQVQEILAEDQAFIYLYHERFAVVTRQEVRGEVGWTGNYALYLGDVSVSD